MNEDELTERVLREAFELDRMQGMVVDFVVIKVGYALVDGAFVLELQGDGTDDDVEFGQVHRMRTLCEYYGFDVDAAMDVIAEFVHFDKLEGKEGPVCSFLLNKEDGEVASSSFEMDLPRDPISDGDLIRLVSEAGYSMQD